MSSNYDKSVKAVKEYTIYSMVGVGFNPTPGGDTVSAVSIQTLMLTRINEIYGINISKDILMKIIGLATSGLSIFEISKYVTGGLAIPAQVASTAILTYALGMAYLQVVYKGNELTIKTVGENFPSYFQEAAKFVFTEGVKNATKTFGENFWKATKTTAIVLKRVTGKTTTIVDEIIVSNLKTAKDVVTEANKKIIETTEDVATEAVKIAHEVSEKVIKKINPFNW